MEKTNLISSTGKKRSAYVALIQQLALDPHKIYEVELTGATTFDSFRTHIYATIRRVRDDFRVKGMNFEADTLMKKVSIRRRDFGRAAAVYIEDLVPTIPKEDADG